MRLLLDSHFCFWLAVKREKLSQAEVSVLFTAEHDIAFPSVAIWELNIKWEKRFSSGMRKGEADPADVLRILRRLEVPSIDLTPEIAGAVLLQPPPHSDPFDQLMLTIAQETGRILLTRDDKLRGHPLAFHAE